MGIKPRITFWDVCVVGILLALAWNGSATTILLAVIAFFLYLRIRPSPAKSASALESKSPAPESETDPDENTFIIQNEELRSGGTDRAEIVLDVDIGLNPCKNHFRLRSHFDTHVGKSEYEYRIEGTDVCVRLLQDYSEDYTGGPEWKGWDVRDGVVLESDVRDRREKQNQHLPEQFAKSIENISDRIADLNKATEWTQLVPMGFGGLKYFILSKRLPTADARRYLRHEMERLKLGVNWITKEAAKLGFEPDESRGLRLVDGHDPPTEEDIEKMWAAASIARPEFYSSVRLIAVLQELLGDKTETP
jgi:hypothetical protein